MPEEIVMPRLSDTMQEGTIARWLKREGDAVKTGEPLMEVETDKATMELNSYHDGVLAKILLADLRAYQGKLQRDMNSFVSEPMAARRWLDEVVNPGMERAHRAVGGVGEPIQAYCDLLEVRWLLSERAGVDVGDPAALDALSKSSMPPDSAAKMLVAEASTGQMRALSPEVLADLDTDFVD